MAEPIIKPVGTGFEPVWLWTVPSTGQYLIFNISWSVITSHDFQEFISLNRFSLIPWRPHHIQGSKDGPSVNSHVQLTQDSTVRVAGTVPVGLNLDMETSTSQKPSFVHQKHHHICQWIDKHPWWSHVPLFLHSDWMSSWQTTKIRPQLFFKISPLGQSSYSSATFQNATIFIHDHHQRSWDLKWRSQDCWRSSWS